VSRRNRTFAFGLLWTGGYQVFEAVASLVVMLILVRIIPPAEYGRAAAAVGILAFLNLWSARGFVEHALQTRDGEEPDWHVYWSVSWCFQIPLFIGANVVAVAMYMVTSLRPVAPLLQLGAVGLLIDGLSHLGVTMLRHALNIARLRQMLALSVAVKLIGTLAGGVAGGGAAAIVVGGNVLPAIPVAAYLFTGLGFRPRWVGRDGLFRAVDVFRFGGQRTLAGVLTAARSLIEGLVLPGTIGLEALGLVGRAQALFSVTLGRGVAALSDTAYPFAVKAADDDRAFARWGGMLLAAALLIVVPGCMMLTMHGADIVALLYGPRWNAVVPLVAPGVMAGGAATIVSTCALILLAKRRVWTSVGVDVVAVAVGIAASVVTLVRPSPQVYLWTIAAGSNMAALAALVAVYRTAPMSPSVSALAAAGVASGLLAALLAYTTHEWMGGATLATRLAGAAASMTVAAVIGFALVYRRQFASALALMRVVPQPAAASAVGAPVDTDTPARSSVALE
jgi:PST family polysaccharide transporter